MDDKKQDRLWNGFERQRRNLVLISIVLLLVHYAGLKFTTLNILGNKAELPDQKVIHWVLWVGWFYWGVRYYQYYRDLGDKGYGATFRSHLMKLAKKPLKKAARGRGKYSFSDENGDLYTLEKIHDPSIVQADIIYFKGYVRYDYCFTPDNLTPIRFKQQDLDVEVHLPQLIIPIIRSVIHVIVSTTLITEYVFPFLMALLPFGYVVYTRFWN